MMRLPTLLLIYSSVVGAFRPVLVPHCVAISEKGAQGTRSITHHRLDATRRSFVEGVAASTLASLLVTETANASGGATAGGAYLLSAKQRYNDRVVKGVKGFLAVGVALDNGDLALVKDYFSGEDAGTWKDLTTAGYLLANAFRRNSTAAPDSLPSVKVRARMYEYVRMSWSAPGISRLASCISS